MAIKVKDVQASAQKFVARAQAAASDYKTGVSGAGSLWANNAQAANDTYVQGVTAAANAGRYRQGVQTAGATKYENNASTKGAQRYPQGVAAAGPSWADKTAKFLQVISSLNLPPRAPRGSPQNVTRVQMIADALHKARLGG